VITRRSLLGGTAAGAAFTLIADRADAAPAIGATLTTGLVVPWGLAFLPDGDGLVSARESGNVWRVRRSGGRTLVGRIADADGAANGEGGLLGVAIHGPTFRAQRWVYFYLTTGSDCRVIRVRFVNGKLSGQREDILSGIPWWPTHIGGRIKFGPDGKLYVGTGDAAPNKPVDRPDEYSAQRDRAQDLDSMAGKILRINPDGSAPGDNPYSGSHSRARVWSCGHRNVQGLSWDRDGRMLAAELGQNTRDELNVITKGGNYGWPVVEGGDGPGGYEDPFVSWTPEECSPSGVATARGRAWVAALRGRSLWAVELFGSRARRKTRYFHDRLGRIRTVERAPDGSLWLMTSNRDGRGTPRRGDDKVVRVVFR
jgi:glucose/arabinose dehydrogenase